MNSLFQNNINKLTKLNYSNSGSLFFLNNNKNLNNNKTSNFFKQQKNSFSKSFFSAAEEKKELPEFLQIVQETLPAVAQLGTTFTKTFYGNMFSKHPELLNVFNKTNQAKGTQPAALFNMIAKSATDVLTTGQLNQHVLDLVGHKHCALNVTAAQYDVVGEHILQTIKQLLNPPQKVIDAWAQLYGVLAKEMIDVEEDIYQKGEKKAGGWRGLREFQVIDKQNKSKDVQFLTFKPTDEGNVAYPEPGQYITVWAKDKDWVNTQPRHYTVTFPSSTYYSIAVKKQGLVSEFLHDKLNVGDKIEISPPYGLFTVPSAHNLWSQPEYIPVVFISAGVGITPVLSMLDSIARSNRPVYWYHASGDGSHHPFRDYLIDMAKTRPNFTRRVWYENPTELEGKPQPADNTAPYHFEGRIDFGDVDKSMVAPHPETNYYICGPEGFMEFVKDGLTKDYGIKKEAIHFENFGSEMVPDNLE